MKHWWFGALAVVIASSCTAHAAAEKNYGPGVTNSEIKIGNTTPYSGGASSYGTIGRAESAVFDMINERGGINGRKIRFLSRDDSYSPPKTVEHTRRLVEQDEVLLIFAAFGTATTSATQKYLSVPKGAADLPDQRRQYMGRCAELSLDQGLAAHISGGRANARPVHSAE